MASYQYLVRTGSCSTGTRGHGYSKAQFSLLKILHLISTVPPTPNIAEISEFSFSRANFQLELNLRLGLSSAESFAEDEADSSAVGSKFQRGTRNVVVLQEQELDEEEAAVEKCVHVSYVTDSQKHVQVESFEADHPAGTGRLGGQHSNVKGNEDDGDDHDGNDIVEASSLKSKRPNGKDFAVGCGGGVRSHNGNDDENGFELLIKAAKLISGTEAELNLEEDETSGRNKLIGKERTGRGRKRGNSSSSVNHVVDCCVDLENSPVVRSKRGRNQSLPYRYRDSVMEPLKRSGSGGQPQRLPSTNVGRK